jgi:hypothetical protein
MSELSTSFRVEHDESYPTLGISVSRVFVGGWGSGFGGRWAPVTPSEVTGGVCVFRRCAFLDRTIFPRRFASCCVAVVRSPVRAFFSRGVPPGRLYL